MLPSPTTSSSLSALHHPSDPLVTFHRLPARIPSSPSAGIYKTTPPAHHVVLPGSDNEAPPASFKNPWPSFAPDAERGFFSSVHAKFLAKGRNYVPLPTNRDELVEVVRPDWGRPEGQPSDQGSAEGTDESRGSGSKESGGGEWPNEDKLKATWLGHASWLIETGIKKHAPICTPSITLTSPIEKSGGDDWETVTTMLTPLPDEPGIDDVPPPPNDDDDPPQHDPDLPRVATAMTTMSIEKDDSPRGIRLLLDPVFSSRMSAVRFAGPKRFTPPPCTLQDLPDPIDVVLISHDHYDHLDAPTIKFLVARDRDRERRLRLRAKLLSGGNASGNADVAVGRGILFVCGLGVGKHLQAMGVREEELVELDWWEGVRVGAAGGKGVRVTCAPAQHHSGRGVWGDAGKALWCSWVVEELGLKEEEEEEREKQQQLPPADGGNKALAPANGCKRIFFAGDTGYRTVPEGATSREDVARLPRCPAFAEVGELYGPFDLALLPIGGYAPRSFLSPVHADPGDAVQMHMDLRSRRSVGMHWGTVRGGISEQYEDVREPPRLWREEAEREGLGWGEEVGVCKVGETVLV